MVTYVTTKDTTHVQEYYLYGSSRLGTYTPQANDQGKLILGLRNYELTNHLGNVLAVISDKKKQDLTADIVSASDYYPFGMPLKSRSFEKKKYRFGFNEHEKDKSFGRGHVNFGARIYDAETGRWLSRDPHEAKYPSLTPYNFVANMPLSAIDPDGKDIIILADKDGAGGTGHRAILIGNQKDGWIYMSKDGFQDSPFNSKPKFSIVHFNKLEDFVMSDHNFVLKEGYIHSADINSEGENGEDKRYIIDGTMYKRDKEGKKIQRYDNAFYIDTDENSNSVMVDAAEKSLDKPYCLGSADCSDVATAALSVGIDRNGNPLKTGDYSPQGEPMPENSINAVRRAWIKSENLLKKEQPILLRDYKVRIFFMYVEAQKDFPNNKYDNIRKENSEVGYDRDEMLVPHEANKW